MTKQLTINGNDILLVEVPEDAVKFFVVDYDDLNLVWRLKDETTGFAVIPSGQWELIGKGDEISEDGWAQIFPNPPYVNYVEQNILRPDSQSLWVQTRTESGHSLLKREGLKQGTTVILKKVK